MIPTNVVCKVMFISLKTLHLLTKNVSLVIMSAECASYLT